MALLGNQFVTLQDWKARTDEKGNVEPVIDLLSQLNEVLDDMLWTEANQITGHKTVVRTGLPAAYWRQYNAGVPRSKSSATAITEPTGMLEANSAIDRDIANLNGATGAFRLTEELPFLEGLSQKQAQTLFYGNHALNPLSYNGLTPRFSTANVANANNAVNVIDAGGTGSTNASIWLLCWGPTTLHGIFPKGSLGGLQMRDTTTDAAIYDAAGNPFYAYTTHFKWDCGLAVRDWRYIVRIANIDVTALTGAAAANLISLLVALTKKPPTMPRTASMAQSATKDSGTPLAFGRPAIYMNRTISTALDLQAMNKSNVHLKQDEFDGKPTTSFLGLPIRIVDQLLNTEARVV